MTFSQFIFCCQSLLARALMNQNYNNFAFHLTKMMELITTKKLPSQNTWLWLKVWGCTDSTFMLLQAESERPHKFYTTVEPRLHLYNHQTQLHWELVKWFYWNSILNTSPTCHGMQGTSERNQSKQRACIPGMKASGTQSDLQTKNTLLSCLIARCEVQGKFWLLQTVLFICNLKVEGLPEMENIYHLYACVHLTEAHKIAKSHAVFQNLKAILAK